MESAHAAFEELDNLKETGRFFIALTERLRDRAFEEQDAARLAHSLGLPILPGLRGASIAMMEDGERASAADRPSVVITFPPVKKPGSDVQEIKKCYTVCVGIEPFRVCGEVCVELDVDKSVFPSLSGKVSVKGA